MLFLRIQDALAARHWGEALSLCSDRLRAKAAEWPTPQAFFSETVPLPNLLAQDFGCWRCGSNSFGLLVPLTERHAKPFIQWYWAIYQTNETWVADYPPVKLDQYIANKKESFQKRDTKFKQIRQSLEPKLKGLKTHLSAVSETFVVGSPMLFRLELLNLGTSGVHYQNVGIVFHALTVLDHEKKEVPSREELGQFFESRNELAPGASVVLADKMDISSNHHFTEPGKYYVQFSGVGLEIGEPIPFSDPGPYAENEEAWPFTFISALASVPSEILEIEVTRPQR